MSGVVGILNLDGHPVDSEILQKMMDCLAFRGPDDKGTWQEGNAGLGHTLFATTFEAEREQQPATLDGDVWITADARIDGRNELRKELEANDRPGLSDATDVELILHAYYVWGENCLHHLLGDFAFGIWDSRSRRLFCARDHFGLKPLYYASLTNVFIFSNTINAIRAHRNVSTELDELAVADFLLFGSSEEPDATTFRDIRSLLPGHSLSLEAGKVSIQMYWALTQEGKLRYRRDQEYIDHFLDLFDRSVIDRLRRPSVTIELSGGLDSASIAATALQLDPACILRARTTVYDRSIPDVERYWSSLLTAQLGIHQQIIPIDDDELYEDWTNPIYATPEPVIHPWAASQQRSLNEVLGTRVVLNGTGGDPALYPSRTFPFRMIRQGRVVELGQGMLNYYRLAGRFPPPYLRSGLAMQRAARRTPEPITPALPSWLSPELVNRYGLVERVVEKNITPERNPHSMRPEAYAGLDRMFWRHNFKSVDAQNLKNPVEWRYPFFDVRLITYVLSIPPLPWFENKLILRLAMRGRLPEEIRLRPKTPLQGNPQHPMSANVDLQQLTKIISIPGIERFIDREAALEEVAGDLGQEVDPDLIRPKMAPFAFAFWLQQAIIEL